MSGMTRSMPSISSSGNIRPASTTIMSSPCSMAIMFLPISPTPPSGITRSASVTEQCRLHYWFLFLHRPLWGGWLCCEVKRERGHVGDERRPQRGLMERGGGGIHRKYHEPVGRLADLPVNSGDRLAREEFVHRVPAERDDHARLQDLEVTVAPDIARGDLVGKRVAVLGRPVADDVGDEDLRPVEADALEQLVEELPGRAHEGPALHVLVVPRRLAEEEDPRVAAALSGHRLARAPVERARGAGLDLGSQRLEGFFVHPFGIMGRHQTFVGAFRAR